MTQPAPVEILTLGCRLNLVESEAMRRAATLAGHDNLVIVNSCAVTSEAVRQARQAIRRVRRARPDAEIIVTGCAAETEAAAFSAMPEVSRLIGNGAKTLATTWAKHTSPNPDLQNPGLTVGDIMELREAPAPLTDAIPGHTRGFVQVQTGCDHRCTFCIIPFGRGNSRSVPLGEVIDAARKLVDQGVIDVVLTGVDLTSWGADLPDAPPLGTLIRALLRAVPELQRLRLSSIDSIEADADLMIALAEEERLMPHLHLSLQAGDDMILKRMKRRHLRADAIAFCDEARRLRPDIVFGADLIAGFPTETDAMFARSLDLVTECGLTHLHVFPFSPRPGTPAARMPAVAPALVRERAARLRDAGSTALIRHLDACIGRTVEILAENGGTGRARDFTPAQLPPGMAAGTLFEASVAGHTGTRLVLAPLVAAPASGYRA